MPKEKIRKILTYNQQDVVNLFKIMNTWEKVQMDDVLQLEDKLLKEKAEKLELKRLLEGNRENDTELYLEIHDRN